MLIFTVNALHYWSTTGPEVIKKFMLNSAEHEISTAHRK